MVYYFTSNVVSPSAFIYVGKDKVESKEFYFLIKAALTKTDEDLIKFGLEEDVWFHADKLSSAHIYLRMNESDSWETIPEEVLTDLAQLTKANSIEGTQI
jgi:predicted ribosome quality control (RQC) complex YloA/Tae2 family protein